MVERKGFPELPQVAELLGKVKAGDNDSFNPVFEYYRPHIVRFVRSRQFLAGARDLAEDIAQEVFLKAFLAVRENKWEDRGDGRFLEKQEKKT